MICLVAFVGLVQSGIFAFVGLMQPEILAFVGLMLPGILAFVGWMQPAARLALSAMLRSFFSWSLKFGLSWW